MMMTIEEKATRRFYTTEDKALARNVNILAYLESCGEEFKEVSEGTFQHTVHDSLRYNAKKNCLNWFSRGEKACFNCIDASMLVYDYNFSNAVHDILDKAKMLPQSDKQHVSFSKALPFDYERDVKEVTLSSRAKSYLINERCLHKGLVDYCFEKGLIAGDKQGNVIFKWQDMTGKQDGLVGASVRGTRVIPEEKRTSPDNKYFRKILAGSESHAGFFMDLGTPKTLVIGEAPIDVLSYISRKLNAGERETLKDCRFASMEGLKEKTFFKQVNAITAIQKKHGNTLFPNVVFVIDNDQPAKDFKYKLEQTIQHIDYKETPLTDFVRFDRVSEKPTSEGVLLKDQNDLLREEVRQAHLQLLATKQEEALEKSPLTNEVKDEDVQEKVVKKSQTKVR